VYCASATDPPVVAQVVPVSVGRVAVLEQIAADTRQALQDIRSELRGLREDVNRRLDTVDRRFASLESRAWRNFYWLIAGYAGLLAIMAHGFHWI
jgi:hypothetical protein